MSQTNNNIKNSWSLASFAKEFGKCVSMAHFVNKSTGEEFDSLAFKQCKDDKDSTLVGFGKSLGKLTKAEIANQFHDLQVVELNASDGKRHFKLCLKGQTTWEDLSDLFE